MSSGYNDSSLLSAEFQLYLQTDSAQKSKRSANGDAYFLGVALYFFNEVQKVFHVEQIRLEHLQLLQLWLANEQKIGSKIKAPWGDTTIEYYCRVLKKFFRKMHDTDRLAKNPCRLWKIPKGTGKERQPMTETQFKQLHAAAPEWFKPIAMFVWLTGSRGASVAMLTWADVNFETKQMMLKSRKGGLKKMKIIPIYLYDELFDFLRIEFEKAQFVQSNPVFWGPEGTAVTAQEISSEGSKLIRKVLKLPTDVVFYSIRHAMGRDLAENGTSLETARQALGHSTVNQTSHYSKKIASKTVGDALSKIRGKAKPKGPGNDG
jgi:integrase